MGKIALLADNIINKIAAGEVVERPASVVKELVENSIDAGARNIQVRVAAGGKQSIVVSDDGIGMSAEDVQMSSMRHATSKMHSPADLFDIHTLGFRGEALASIGAVSYMTIESRQEGDPEGTRLVIEGGAVRECQPIGRAVGTTISVRQLFFNTPARRKFLRHIDTETRHINQAIIGLAAGYPEIGFSLDHQDRNVLRFTGSTRIGRVIDLLGLAREELIEVDFEGDGIQIYGGISRPESAAKSKSKHYWLVRGRPIYSRGMTDALYKGYGHWLPEGSHPAFVCWVELDPKQIDVNVHPAKREIRIANERALNDRIEATISDALVSGEERAFKIDGGLDERLPPPTINFTGSNLIRDENKENPANKIENEEGVEWLDWDFDGEKGADQGTLLFQSGPNEDGSEEKVRHHFPVLELENVWQVHERYLICPLSDALLVVDQQAAHERILYEEAKAKGNREGSQIQQLLFPLVLRLGREEHALAVDLMEMFREIGLEVRDFGENSVVVDGVPSEMKNWNDGQVLRQILADVADGGTQEQEKQREKLLISYAKFSSVQDGVKLEESEMISIIRRLMVCPEPYFCPRGRPTIIKVLRRDLDKLFGRM